MSLSFSVAMAGSNATGLREKAAELAPQLAVFGDGQYPNEANADLTNWQNEFWGSNYHRLLNIKRKWDPNNMFTCRECVGAEDWMTPQPDGSSSHGPNGPSSVLGKW